MSRSSLPPALDLLPLDWADWSPSAAAGPRLGPEDEGPIFLCGLDQLLARLESHPDFRPPETSGDTLEALADMLADAGLGR